MDINLSLGAIVTFIILVVIIWSIDTEWRRKRGSK